MTKHSKIEEQRLQHLEANFRTVLPRCLQECAEGRWGLFDPRYRYFEWPEAEELTRNAREIQSLKAQSGDSDRLTERFLYYCELRGPQVLGELKLASQFLDEISTLDGQAKSLPLL